MYDNANINKDEFNRLMEALKTENNQYKALLNSNRYRAGRYMLDLVNAFRSIKSFKLYLKDLNGKFRWRKLCKKYPINVSKSNNSTPNYFSNKRIVVYTCIFGGYDNILEPVFKPDNCDFYIITDQEVSENSIWKKMDVSTIIPDYDKLSNAEKNRYCKMLPFMVFPDAEISIYVDGNIKVVTDLTELIYKISSRYGIAFHLHKARKCVYDEIDACKILKKADEVALKKLETNLRKRNFPENYGMPECNVIVRNHSNEIMRNIMNEWWKVFLTGDVKRDQLTLPYILWKHGISVEEIATLGNNVAENDALLIALHL